MMTAGSDLAVTCAIRLIVHIEVPGRHTSICPRREQLHPTLCRLQFRLAGGGERYAILKQF
jgi:hypothetical protein